MFNILPCLKLPARGFALFAGFYTLMNLIGEIWTARFDATVWLLDPGSLPTPLPRIFLVLFGITMTGFGLFGYRGTDKVHKLGRMITALTGLTAGSIALRNAITFFQLVEKELIAPSERLPLSLFLALGFFLVAVIAILPSSPAPTDVANHRSILHQYAPAAIALIFFLTFPLLQVRFFGTTDYCRQADAVVVFGAKAYANGRPSLVLADRVRHACSLYKRGYVRTLILSGGPGDGSIHETESMKSLAISLGVDEHDILLDKYGLSTEETVQNTATILDSLGAKRIVAVSQDYHLPRIKMTFQRHGLNVYTSPAPDTTGHARSVKQLTREVLAFWIYYLRPLAAFT